MSFAAGKLLTVIGTELVMHVIVNALVEVAAARFRAAAGPGSRSRHSQPQPLRSRDNGAATTESVAVLSHQPGRVRLRIPGLHGDAARAAAIVDALQSLPGVRSASANPLTGNALVRYDLVRVTLSQIQAATVPPSASIAEPGTTDGRDRGAGPVRAFAESAA